MALYYPININLQGKKSLVVGGGEVAQRKIISLLNAHSKVDVISPQLTKTVKGLADDEKIQYVAKEFEPSHLNGVFLVVGATDNNEINSFVSREASKRNILVNIVDIPSECNFIVPSVVEKGDLVISISTSGSSPALAKKIRKELEGAYGDEYALFLDIMRSIRQEVITIFPDHIARSKVFTKIVYNKDILHLLKEGRKDMALKIINEVICKMKEKGNE